MSELTPEIHQHFLMPLANPEEREGCWTFPKQIIASSDWLANMWTRRDALNGKIKLIVWGMKDIAFREKELNHLIVHFPDAKVVRYTGAGHFLAKEKADELIRELTEMLEL